MKRKIRKIILLIFIVSSLSSCEKNQNSNIPYVRVNVSLDLNEPEFFDLRAPGNSIALKDVVPSSVDGYAGIIVVCSAPGVYYAYDQCCTVNPEMKHLVIPDGAKGICEDCASQFYLLDGFGTVLEEPATLPLLRYNVNLVGSRLIITNYQ